MGCQHLNFKADVNVRRLTADTDKDKVVGFAADVKIACVDCGMPFEFIGLPKGISMTNSKPMVSMDATELRCPITPSTDPAEHLKSLLNG